MHLRSLDFSAGGPTAPADLTHRPCALPPGPRASCGVIHFIDEAKEAV